MILDVYKNNNGNSSLGLVPIHRSQPRLFTMSDYCYSDRLLHMAEAFSATPCFLVVPVTAEPSGCPFFPSCDRNSGTKCHSGAGTYFPKDIVSVSGNPGPKPVVFCSPVTQSLKERFRFSVTYWTFRTRSPFCSGFGSPDAQTRGSDRNGSCFI